MIKPQVAFLGPENSFHHLACKSYFGDNYSPYFKEGFIEIIESTQSGKTDYGVIAIENSNAGIIGNNIELIVEHGLKVAGAITLRITLYLAAKNKINPEAITDIYSHPAVFEQCAHYLQSFKQAQLHPVSSTAKAAQMAAEKAGTSATICGKPALIKYQLQKIADAKSDKSENTTRFFIIHAGN
ncbi:MAG: prephenate dehydratase, partial [Chitinophagales bacterium]